MSQSDTDPQQPYLKNLEDALQERLDVIADHDLRDRDPQAHLRKLRAAAEHLDALQRQFPSGLDAHLAHFLQNGSYVKARDRVRELRQT